MDLQLVNTESTSIVLHLFIFIYEFLAAEVGGTIIWFI